jgi:hypothetical protein
MKYFTSIVFLLCSVFLNARTFGVFPLFDQARNYYNPAFTGAEGKTRAYAMGSYQYRVSSYPVSINATRNETHGVFDLSCPVYERGHQQLAVGLNYSRQKYDAWEIDDIRLNLGYMHALGKHKLSYGANLDWIQDYVDYRGLNNITTPFKHHSLNTGFGAAFHHVSGFYIGASANTILHNQLVDESGQYVYKIYYSNYFINSGTDIRLAPQFTLKPSVMICQQRVWWASGNLILQIRKRFEAGVSYNSILDQPGFRIGYQDERIGVHYSYGTLLATYRVNPGSHALLLSYAL